MLTIAKVLLSDKDRKVLILTRSDSHPRYNGHNDLPGGEVEEGEDVFSAVARELVEETGIILEAERLKKVHSVQISPNKTYVLLTADTPKNIVINLSWEHSAYSWKTIDELLSEPLPDNADSYYQMVVDYLNQTKT